jgi:hypothetical protein
MGGHLSETELARALSGETSSAAAEHLSRCSACGERLDEVLGMLATTRSADDVPEPSPLYWEAMRRRVRHALQAEPRPRAAWWANGWRLAPLAGAAAALLVALAVGRGPGPSPTGPEAPAAPIPAWSALPPVGEDEDLELVEAALADTDLPSSACAGILDCLASLDAEEADGLGTALAAEAEEGVS